MRSFWYPLRTLAVAALSTAIAALPATALEAEPAEAPAVKDTILILDASGSMWGQIDGINKIVIARDVVEGLVRNLPEQQRLGFIAYGHRREGDCNDIETLATVGAERADIIEAIRGVTAKGKTPLSKSVEHAATELDFTRQAATVILVSDGLENCDLDPCELAHTLEEAGLDFTVHVIGFDVTAEERNGLECIAEETGGQFLAADNAAELTAALLEVAVAPLPTESTPVPSRIVLKATILPGGPQIASGLNWSVIPSGGGDPVFSAPDSGSVESEILPGDYLVQVSWNGWRDGLEKSAALDITIQEQNTHVYTIPIDLNLPVVIEAPSETAEGRAIEVAWSGPDKLGATLSVNRPDDPPSSQIFFFATQKSRNAFAAGKEQASIDSDSDGDFDEDDMAKSTLATPPEAGEYELRYTLSDPGIILARRPLTVTASTYSLAASAQADISMPVEISWSGDLTHGDIITIVPAGAEAAFDNARYTTLKEGEPAVLTAPKEPGDYEIRYVMHGGYTTYPGMQYAVQASIPLEVTDVTASVSAASSAVGGSTIEIDWRGPEEGWQDDYISIIEPGASRFNRDSWSSLAERDGTRINPARIRVPAIEGTYELVYLINPGGRIIDRQPIEITRAMATLEAPESVIKGEAFQVSWTGDAFPGDRVVFTRADTPDEKMWGLGVNYGFAVAPGSPSGVIKSRLTAEAGEYEVRYVTGLQHQVLARDHVTVK